MQVSELIDLVSQLSFSRNLPTLKERKNYLRFLNLANLELWQIAVNADIFFEEKELFIDKDSLSGAVPDGYYIKALFNGKDRLSRCRLNEIFNPNSLQYMLTNNRIILSKVLNLPEKEDVSDSGKRKPYIRAILLPNTKSLVESVVDRATELDTPPYPEPYHLALVHGALFYLYLSGKGFAEKIKYQMLAWDEAKKSLKEYYRH